MKKVEIIKICYMNLNEILMGFIEKSYMIFKGTGIVFFEDSGISLIVFSEKSCGNPKGRREMKEIPYRAELKKLYDEKILRIPLLGF